MRHRITLLFLAAAALAASTAAAASYELLNVSYDPTRELYRAINAAFSRSTRRRPATTSPSGSRTAAPARRPAP